ncbi:MAG TPA: CDP-glycerol glycerophosphotransferase family protein [bacterium]|nr:CDP-glycerol glycerophosphotransferase family protein [bacterium]
MKKYKKIYYQRNGLIKFFYVLCCPVVIISLLIPKKKGLKIYGSMFGFDIVDNSKYKFINEYDELSYFITKNKEKLSTEILPKIYPVYCYSLKGIFLQLRAEKIFYTHSIYDFNPLLIWGSRKIALWHGVPIKIIGPDADWKNKSKITKILKKTLHHLFPYLYYMYCDEIICPFNMLVDEYKKYFRLSHPRILIEEQPRVRYAVKNIPSNNFILYAPTYRLYMDLYELCEKSRLFDCRIIDYLKTNNIFFVIRPHPIDVQKFTQVLKKKPLPDCFIIDRSADLYNTITMYKLVLTDYSSIYYDCKSLKIKCLLIAPDLDLYINNVGISDAFLNFIKHNHFNDFIELLQKDMLKLD